MSGSKTYYGETIVDLKELIEANIKRCIKLEYYGIEKVTQNKDKEYGIEVIKKEYINKEIMQEVGNVHSITESKIEMEGIIEILKRNKVTPIGLADTINDLIKAKITD